MDLRLIRGDTYTLTFALLDSKGIPFQLAASDRCYFTVKKSFESTDFVLQRTYGNGISYNIITGLYEIEITQDNTSSLTCGCYCFDIKVKINNQIVKTLVKGNLFLENNATHRGNE